MVEADAILKLQLSIDNFEPAVRHRVGMRVASIRIRRRQCPDGRSSCILSDRGIRQRNGRRPFVDVRNRDVERLRGRCSRGVGRRHRDRNVRLTFVVEANTILKLQLSVDNFEPIVGHRVGMRVASIRIRRRQRAHRSASRVLRNRRVRERDIRRPFVDVRNRNVERFGDRRAARIGGRHRHRDEGFALVIEANALLELQLPIDHFEAGVRHRIGVRIAAVTVGCAQRADNRASRVLRNRCIVQRDVCRRMIPAVRRRLRAPFTTRRRWRCRRQPSTCGRRGSKGLRLKRRGRRRRDERRIEHLSAGKIRLIGKALPRGIVARAKSIAACTNVSLVVPRRTAGVAAGE